MGYSTDSNAGWQVWSSYYFWGTSDGQTKVYLEPGGSVTVSFSSATTPGAAPFARVARDGSRQFSAGDVSVSIGWNAVLSRRLVVEGESVHLK